MVTQLLISKKIIVGVIATFFFLNFGLVKSKEFKVEFYNYLEQNDQISLYGNLIVNKKENPIILYLEEKSYYEEKNYNEDKKNKEEKYEKKENTNERVIDNKTPGKRKIIIEDGKGKRVVYESDMGSKEPCEFDQEIIRDIMSSAKNFADRMSNKTVREKINNFINGFIKYANGENKSQSKWRLPFFRNI